MPYRVIRQFNPQGRPDPVYFPQTWDRRSEAQAEARSFARRWPQCSYVVVGSPNAYRWVELLQRHSPTSPAPGTFYEDDVSEGDEEGDDEEDQEWCDFCNEAGHDQYDRDYHDFFYCHACGWGCEQPDCQECVHYSESYDGLLCDHCYDEYDVRRNGRPGIGIVTRSCCNTHNLHHDDVTETFVCDCEARRLLADGRPVTLAYPLPDLMEVA